MEFNTKFSEKMCEGVLEGTIKGEYFLGGKKVICPFKECKYGNHIIIDFEGEDYNICRAYLIMKERGLINDL